MIKKHAINELQYIEKTRKHRRNYIIQNPAA